MKLNEELKEMIVKRVKENELRMLLDFGNHEERFSIEGVLNGFDIEFITDSEHLKREGYLMDEMFVVSYDSVLGIKITFADKRVEEPFLFLVPFTYIDGIYREARLIGTEYCDWMFYYGDEEVAFESVVDVTSDEIIFAEKVLNVLKLAMVGNNYDSLATKVFNK